VNMTTKRAIQDAFTQLLEEKPYSRITVQNIADRCGISRNTFYYHFSDIESLFESAVEDWAERCNLDRCTLNTPIDCLRMIASEGRRRQKLIYYVIRSKYRSIFFKTLQKLVDTVLDRYMDQKQSAEHISAESRKIITRFYRSIFMGQIMDWIESGMEYDLIAFTTKAMNLVFGADVKKPL
jgi:AcrR family transcriptional regulator